MYLSASCSKVSKWEGFVDRFESVSTKDTTMFRYFEGSLECDSEFTSDENGNIFFARNIDGLYKVIKYTNDKERCSIWLSNEISNVSKPFIMAGSPVAMLDSDTFGKYDILATKNSAFLGYSKISKVFSFDNGRFLIVKYEKTNLIAFMDQKKKIRKSLEICNGVLYGASLSNKSLALSVGNDIYLYDIDLDTLRVLDIGIGGPKLNPYLYNNSLYFASNKNQQYYNIVEHDIRNNTSKVVLSSDCDLRLPKRYGNKLYYIAVSKSEYLLRCRNLNDCSDKKVTLEGVTYDFHAVGNYLYFVYSDMRTPRTLRRWSTLSDEVSEIHKTTRDILTKSFFQMDSLLGPAYFNLPKSKQRIKGIILYFHPTGLEADFSPRWDNMITPLCDSGYVVIAPNFPGSFGYGKAYSSAPLNRAIFVMMHWKNRLKVQYPNLPIFFYGISSGSDLLEATLALDPSGVCGAISAFGLNHQRSSEAVPTLYFLGKLDPIIPIKMRLTKLTDEARSGGKVVICTLDNEGHWIQSPGGFVQFYKKTFFFLNNIPSFDS